MTERVQVATTFDEAERLQPQWDALPWPREEAERELFLARTRARDGVIGPFVALAPDGGIVARVEHARLPAQVGYRTVYAPRVRLLQVVDGGIVGASDRLVATLRRALADGVADVVKLPALPVVSPYLPALSKLGLRQPCIAPWVRRRLVH